MTKPSAPAQEWVAVPAQPTVEWSGRMRARGYAGNNYDAQSTIREVLAAAPDSGLVPVPVWVLQQLFSQTMPVKGGDEYLRDTHLSRRALKELRALLSRAGNKGDGR